MRIFDSMEAVLPTPQGCMKEINQQTLNSDAFSKGTWVNVTAACRTAVSGNIEKSIVEQFSKKLYSTSKVFGSDVRTFFGGGVQSDCQLLEKK